MTITQMQEQHWPSVQKIYEEGIATGNATFQSAIPSWQEWDASHLSKPRLVAEESGVVLGWAALTPVSGRCVYAGVAEVSIYMDAASRGSGLGKQLLQVLVNESEEQGLWTLQAGIFPENTPSIKIHEQCGFRLVGYREKIGQMNGVWRDTLLFERRSNKTGV